MHDIRLIRENPDAFDKGVTDRGLSSPRAAELIGLDEARRAAISALQVAQESRNSLSKEIGAAKKARDEVRAQSLMEEVARLKTVVPELEEAEKAAVAALDKALGEIPNLPGADVPQGADEHGNVERKDHAFAGARPRLNSARQHFELAEAWAGPGGTLMDFGAAAKLSGSRFVVLRGQVARLERALGQFMLDLHTGEHGYTEVAPPLLVRDEVMFGTAQLPKFREDQFRIDFYNEKTIEIASRKYLESFVRDKVHNMISSNKETAVQMIITHGMLHYHDHIDEFFGEEKREILEEGTSRAKRLIADLAGDSTRWLIPTAEVPLTNLVREQILAEDELPLRFAALTPCFRAEAGAAGRDTRGMLRQHQFQKCELVSITTPERSAEEHERMLGCAEAVLKQLDLPFRVMTLCTGDMGFAAQKTYDIEVWLPGQGAFREISSCSVCGDFQARRMEARFRPKEGKGPRFVHTLNGSGVAVGRALIAVLENYQQPDGSVVIPDALKPYMGGVERIGG